MLNNRISSRGLRYDLNKLRERKRNPREKRFKGGRKGDSCTISLMSFPLFSPHFNPFFTLSIGSFEPIRLITLPLVVPRLDTREENQ